MPNYQYNLLKEQSKTLQTRELELEQVRNELYRTKQMNTKWNEETREKANSFRTEKRRILQEQGKVNDELQDKDVGQMFEYTVETKANPGFSANY